MGIVHFDAHGQDDGIMNEEPTDPPITMRDIARTLGIAQSTVSRALRNDPRISSKVRTRVAARAKEMGYRPNPFVSAFTSQVRTHRRSPFRPNIAFLDCLSEGQQSFFQEYAEGARSRAHALGFGTEMIRFRDLQGSVTVLNRILRARGLVGLLVLPVPDGTDLSAISYQYLAAATVDPSLRHPDMHRATPDYFQSMELILNKLTQLGYRRIAFCTHEDEVARIAHRWLGSYHRWQASTGTNIQPYIAANWESRDFIRYLRAEKPDALVSNSGLVFMQWAREAGFRFPEDIAFANLGAKASDPQFAGVDQNGERVGAAAIDLIVAQIYRNEFGLPEYPKSVSIRSRWVDGTSVPPRP